MVQRSTTVIFAGLLLVGCASKPDLPTGAAAYSALPTPATINGIAVYRIGPLDRISVNVFQEADLSQSDVQVDAAGTVLLPLVGAVQASGLTPDELSKEIARRLAAQYLEKPQVTVVVQTAASQRVTVEGEVNEPGVFKMEGRTTLLDALAMAKGVGRNAAFDEIVVIRQMDGKQYAGMFNLSEIQRSKQPNLDIVGNDVVIVGLSNAKSIYRDLLATAPLIAVLRPFN